MKTKISIRELKGLPKQRFKRGDRVIYYVQNLSYEGVSTCNPLYGSKHFCIGTVRSLDDRIKVDWDNGENNSYIIGDLILESELVGIIQPT